MASMSAASLHAALAKHRERAPYGRLPQDLRRQAKSYTQERVRTGVTTAAIASELGVSETTVRGWVEGPSRARSAGAVQRTSSEPAPFAMVPLMVRSGPEAGTGTRLEVSFPDGTKVQVMGMGGRELVEAITALRGAR
jgi:hypothetical protein